MDGLIFNCDVKELKYHAIDLCSILLQYQANRKFKTESKGRQQIIDEYIDLVIADEEEYMERLKNSDDSEDKMELQSLDDCKKIMDLKYWKNYSHLIALYKEGFWVGQHY